MADRLKPGSPQWVARNLRHRHNGFKGSVEMSLSQMRAIASAPTTTEISKQKARRIEDLLLSLRESLKERVDA